MQANLDAPDLNALVLSCIVECCRNDSGAWSRLSCSTIDSNEQACTEKITEYENKVLTFTLGSLPQCKYQAELQHVVRDHACVRN
jgi:hypothetical protein